MSGVLPTKFRTRAWLDTSKLGISEFPIKHGVQVFVPKRGWAHCTRGTEVLLFDNAADAKCEVKRLRKAARDRAALAKASGSLSDGESRHE